MPHDIVAHRLRRPRRRPVLIADVETDAVGPLEGIVFEDKVVAAISTDHAPLRYRETIARVLER